MKKITTPGKRIREWLDINQMRQADLLRKAEPYCKKAGITIRRNEMSQYISGRNNPKHDKLIVMAEAMHVDEAWLSGFDVPMNDLTAIPPPGIPKTKRDQLIELASSMSDEEADRVLRLLELISNKN